MTSSLRITTLALVLAGLPFTTVQAGEARQQPTSARDRAAIETAQKFSLRMSRLDALMGGAPHGAASTRARSADAAH